MNRFFAYFQRSVNGSCSSSRASIFFWALLLLIAANQSFAADCLVPADGASVVTLRAAPTAKSAIRGTLKRNELLPLVALMPGWYETRLSDGQMAFAAKRSTQIEVCPSEVGVASSAADTEYELHAIDVGTGLAVLVRGPDFALLYDAGSNDDTARGDDNRVVAYLNTLQPPIQKINHVVLSHPHRDHVELLPDIVTRYSPNEVWNSGAFNNICGYRNFLFAIAANPAIQYHTATQDAGAESIELSAKNCYREKQPAQTLVLSHAKKISNETIPLGKGASMTFLFADGSPRSSANENSLVVRLDLGTRRVLLMGDAEAGGRKLPTTLPSDTSIEGKLLACCTADVKADVLVVGHHSSKTSSRIKFLDAVNAKTFIVSAGPTKYANVVLPDNEIIVELEKRGLVLRTDIEDAACLMSPDKVGPDADGQAGGCDNILVKFFQKKAILAEYRRISD